MQNRPFLKMHGLGNDFVVIDARARPFALSSEAARAIADRRRGVGCDQVVVIEQAPGGEADAFMRIRNADGGEVAACGNASRCVAALLMAESGRERARIATLAGLLEAEGAPGGTVTIDMGQPRLTWRDIPLAEPMETLHLPLVHGPLADGCAVGMGNPHAVFFVADAEAVELARLGPALERHALFPERANIGVAQILGADRIRLRVWERGAGLTPACGTGACAAAVAAHRRGLAGRAVAVVLDGGTLAIAWGADDHVRMTGPVAISFRGTLGEGLGT